MEFRQSSQSDLSQIMKIIEQAQEYFKKQGIHQWQNNYPNETVISGDIDKKISYVLTEGTNVIGTTALSFEEEVSYGNIEGGSWLTNDRYGVIHRIAVDNACKGKGIGGCIIDYAEQICLKLGVSSIRADTHENNQAMQCLLQKKGFSYCGVIYLQDGAKRVAFEKTIK